jgi:YHS domain-containing protein
MKLSGICKKTIVLACVTGLFSTIPAIGQTEKSDSSTAVPKAITVVKQLKPQTTCPVMGGEINKSLFVDYKGKRIFVCCEGCLEKLKKNPEKYIKKLEKMGQTPETIPQEKSE